MCIRDRFSGVSEVYSAHRLLLGPWSPQIERIRNSFHRKRSGDLLMEILPGWTIMQENSTDNRVVRTADIPAPLILLGGGMKAETIRIPISIDRIAQMCIRDRQGHLWSRFGMDLCMGSKADEPINRRLAMFVPFYMQEYFNKAQIVDKEGQTRPLVAKEEKKMCIRDSSSSPPDS